MPAGLSERRWFILGCLVELGLGGISLVAGKALGLSPLATLSWTGHDALLGAVSSLPLIGLFWWTLRSRLASLQQINDFLESVVRPAFAPLTVLELLLISVLAGIGEELLFRGLLQGGLAAALGTVTGVLLAAAAFGLAHCITPTYALVAGLIGAYLSALWITSGNLLVPIISHALYDFLALVLFLKLHSPNHGIDSASEGPWKG
jgi:uncharacterized protein